MESINNNNNNNNNQMFLCEFKELRKELSKMKKRIDQLEKSHEKQQEKIDVLVRENHALKTELSINGNKEGESLLKRKRTDQEEEIESKSTLVSASTRKKKTKTNNDNNNADEVALLSLYDNGDSFDSLSDDLLHKIVEFDGNCYSKFGSINKRCKNIYDVKAYKLKKQTCVYGYGTVEMMLQHYLQRRREDVLGVDEYIICIAKAVIFYNRFDAIEWIIQLGDDSLFFYLYYNAAQYGRINILSKVFCKCNLTTLDKLLNNAGLCYAAAQSGQFKTLKWVRKYGAELDAETLIAARDEGYDEMVQYLRLEGCPEKIDDESEESEQVRFDDEDGDY